MGWHEPEGEAWAVVVSDLGGGGCGWMSRVAPMFFPPCEAFRKGRATHVHLMVRQKHRNRGVCRSHSGFGLDSEIQSQFLSCICEAQMSDIDKMEETNVFANWEKGGLHGNASFPFLCDYITRSQEETVIYLLSAR